jgi:hypothetical protein
MTKPVFSVELLEGKQLMLYLRTSSDTSPVVGKALNERNEAVFEAELEVKDQEEFKETVGEVNILLLLPSID